MPIQIDMEMPEECTFCKFRLGDALDVSSGTLYINCILKNWVAFPIELCKSPDCPLKEVK